LGVDRRRSKNGGGDPKLPCISEFVDATLELWQRRTSRVLTREDGRQIAENVTGFFQLLSDRKVAEMRAPKTTAEVDRAVAVGTERNPE
jgi:hypothetical protein